MPSPCHEHEAALPRWTPCQDPRKVWQDPKAPSTESKKVKDVAKVPWLQDRRADVLDLVEEKRLFADSFGKAEDKAAPVGKQLLRGGICGLCLQQVLDSAPCLVDPGRSIPAYAWPYVQTVFQGQRCDLRLHAARWFACRLHMRVSGHVW